MSWYKKSGSDFSVEGYDYSKKREDLSDITSYLQNVLWNEMGLRWSSTMMIEPDGDDFNKSTGVINFYVGNNEETSKNPKPYVDKVLEVLHSMGCDTGPITTNTFEDYRNSHPEWNLEESEKDKSVRVVRIPVTKNNPPKRGYPPSVHWNTGAAKKVIEDLMGLDFYKPLPAWQIANGIKYLTDAQIEEVAKNMVSSDDTWEIDAKVEDLRRRLRELEALAKWASKNGYVNLIADY